MVKTEAIILKTADLGEADQLLTIYSKEFGKIRVIARGIKRLESKLRYHLEPLTYNQLILIEGKSFRIVKDAILLDEFLLMRKELEKTKIAYKIAELIDQAIVDEEKDEKIWSLLLKTLKNLNVGHSTSNIAKDFQNSLIRLLGYDPSHIKDLADIY